MIYFIQDTVSGLIKIGHAADVRSRFSQIQTHCPTKLAILGVEDGCEERERELHGAFAAARSRGEWFCPSADVLSHVATHAKELKRQSASQSFWGGLKAIEVAAITGISQAMISRIQNGERTATPQMALKLQRATGVSAIKLVFGELAEEAA